MTDDFECFALCSYKTLKIVGWNKMLRAQPLKLCFLGMRSAPCGGARQGIDIGAPFLLRGFWQEELFASKKNLRMEHSIKYGR
jgi:hypothetical protein